MTQLAAAFPTAEVASGERSGVSLDKDRINVFAGPWRKDSGRAVVAQPTMIVRYWPARGEQPATATPHDPDELDDALDALLAALRPLQASLAVTNLWYFLVDSSDTDEDPAEWGVEARLVGYGKNLATIS